MYPIQQVLCGNEGKKGWIQLMFDSGADLSVCLEKTAKELNFKLVKTVKFKIRTINGIGPEKSFNLYEFPLYTLQGEPKMVRAFGVEKISSRVDLIDEKQINY